MESYMSRSSENEMMDEQNEFWCYTCQAKVQTQQSNDGSSICKTPCVQRLVGSSCLGCFVELIETHYGESEVRPEMYEPYNYPDVGDNENSIEALSLEVNVS